MKDIRLIQILVYNYIHLKRNGWWGLKFIKYTCIDVFHPMFDRNQVAHLHKFNETYEDVYTSTQKVLKEDIRKKKYSEAKIIFKEIYSFLQSFKLFQKCLNGQTMVVIVV